MAYTFIKVSLITLFIAILLLGAWEIFGVDLETGKRLAENNCGVCHDLTVNKIHEKGPFLWGIVGRPAGSVGFNYSEAFLQRVNTTPFVWDDGNLNQYLKSPDDFLHGTRMSQQISKHDIAFSGMDDRHNRNNLIAYLKTLR